MSKWYEGIYRRQLTDMHIADDDPLYLAEFDEKHYCDCLEKAHIQSPMIYLQSHTGLCNFPTSVARTHKAMEGENNAIKRLISLCKERGMKVVGYYSLIFNNFAASAHPNWQMRFKDGATWQEKGQRYGLCCPNNEEYRGFLRDNILELARCFPSLDGIFYDMPYWEVPCHCPSCKARYKKETGRELPEKEDWGDANWLLYVKKRQDWMAEFASYVRKLSLEAMPEVTVEFNFAAVIGCDWLSGSSEGINEESEFTGGDLYGDLYSHSFTAKYYYAITKNQPFEYMTCRCNKNLREHTITKPQEMLDEEIMLTLAHHGATLIIDAINPDGTLDERAYEKVGKAFEKQIPYEKYMDQGELYADLAIYFDSKTMFKAPYVQTYNKLCAKQAHKTLVESHIATALIANGAMNDLGKYKMILAPCLQDFDNEEPLKLIEYVKEGGALYLSGKSDARLMKEFFDATFLGYTFGESKFPHVEKGYDEVQAYLSPCSDYQGFAEEFNDKYPLPITYKLPIYRLKGEVKGRIVLPYTDPDDNRRFASIHSNPPGIVTDIPSIVTTNYGKGKVIWTSALLENDERSNFKEFFKNIVLSCLTPKYHIKASKFIESVIFESKECVYINFVNVDPSFEKIERTIEMQDLGKAEVSNLTTGEKIEVREGKIELKIVDFAMIRISF